MTTETLTEKLLLEPSELVAALQVSDYVVPKWSDLEKQYDPMLHSIFDTTKYPAKLDDNNTDDFKRTPLALQKLATNRISQSMFATPVERVYSYDNESEQANEGVNILEQLYRTTNFIDAENIERAKQLNSTCQMVTVWSVYEKQLTIGNETTPLTLNHNTYSELNGYKLYPILDQNGNMLVISIFYTNTSDEDVMEVYTNGDVKEYRKYVKSDDWVLDELVSKPLTFFSCVYANRKEPVWGGDAGTALVEQLEEMESYQGLYIKRNALPTFVLDYGDVTGSPSNATESSSDSRRIITVGKGGSMADVTWGGSESATNTRYARIRNAYFEQIQMPDLSFANMINSNTSADNKELIFSDAKAKARDLAGEWEQLFYAEMIIVKEFAKVMFPKYSTTFDSISVRSVIHPYSVRSKKETAEYIATASDSMSLQTKIRILSEVDDIAQEVDLINIENGAAANQL